MRVNKLFLRLWVLVVVLLSYRLYPIVEEYIPKEQVVKYHSLNVTIGMLSFVDNKDQLASVIGHELAHIILGHTIDGTPSPEREYHADLLGMMLAHKAGYSLCGVSDLWKRMGNEYLSLHSGSHPNVFIRAHYTKMPECTDHNIPMQAVTLSDAEEVFTNMLKHVEGRIKFKTMFVIFPRMDINAFVYSVTEDKE
jgi:Zn-dependent protease with chaperone function